MQADEQPCIIKFYNLNTFKISNFKALKSYKSFSRSSKISEDPQKQITTIAKYPDKKNSWSNLQLFHLNITDGIKSADAAKKNNKNP